jgi:hypothetical protein
MQIQLDFATIDVSAAISAQEFEPFPFRPPRELRNWNVDVSQILILRKQIARRLIVSLLESL